MPTPCCIKPIAKIIKIGDTQVGLTGLETAFRNVFELKIQDDEIIKNELLSQIIEFGNYITQSRESDYKEALLREYKIFCKIFEVKLKNGK
jgi:hypothetical protein